MKCVIHWTTNLYRKNNPVLKSCNLHGTQSNSNTENTTSKTTNISTTSSKFEKKKV